VLLVLGLVVLFTGGKAFSPGSLTAKSNPDRIYGGFETHADFEAQCRRCHQPLKTTQDQLCLECHTQEAFQIENKQGTHGVIENMQSCQSCHPEHRGNEFDPTAEARRIFNHSPLGFSLTNHGFHYDMNPMLCVDCHPDMQNYAFSLESCTQCHAQYDAEFMAQHSQEYGTQCLSCHDGVDRMRQFDHASTDFPLQGKHADLTCVQCHVPNQTDEQFTQISAECQDCHAEPEVHAGLFGDDCATCHCAQGWGNVVWEGQPFEHFATTGFSLAHHTVNFSGQTFLCRDCHVNSMTDFSAGICFDCHSQQAPQPQAEFMLAHQANVGENCLDCHDGVDSMANFEHASRFPLEGKHAEIDCQSCHINGYKGTPSRCVDCHTEPDIHAGFFGLECQDCHTPQGWSPALLRKHTFPLDHGATAPLTCSTCHVLKYPDYTCYGCHEHQPGEISEKHLEEGISQAELPECARCHPSGQVE
jgi:hypothetical protein